MCNIPIYGFELEPKNQKSNQKLVVFKNSHLTSSILTSLTHQLYIYFPIRKEAEVKNRRTCTIPNVDDRLKNTYHCKTNTFIATLSM